MKSMFCLVIGMALLASVSAFSKDKPPAAGVSANETSGSCPGNKGDDDVAARNAAICKAKAAQGISAAECSSVASKGDSGSQSTTK